MTTPSGVRIPIVPSIAPLAASSRAWLVDIWGVMHNGAVPFLAAAEACRRFRDAGGHVMLLSNAPRPAASVVAQLDRIGVPREAYDVVVSSGDLTRHLLGAGTDTGRVFHLGPERDLALYEGLHIALGDAAQAHTLVCSGLFDDTRETPKDYADLLADFAARKVPMICANPDLTVERAGAIVYCAGALAKAYEELGGVVTYAGKPYLPVYDLAFETLAQLAGGPVARCEVIAIGDGVRTDIAGAAAAGVRSVFVASGVHVGPGGLNEAALHELFAGMASPPVAAMTALAW